MQDRQRLPERVHSGPQADRYSRPLTSSGTSTACWRSASIGTISSARALVAARTTPAAAPAW